MIFEKGEPVMIRSRGLEEIAAWGRGRTGTVQRMMPGNEYVVVEMDDSTAYGWGALMVRPERVERITE